MSNKPDVSISDGDIYEVKSIVFDNDEFGTAFTTLIKLIDHYNDTKKLYWRSVDSLTELEQGVWYWYTTKNEPDLYYPCYIRVDGKILIGDKLFDDLKSWGDFLFSKMPLPPTDKESE